MKFTILDTTLLVAFLPAAQADFNIFMTSNRIGTRRFGSRSDVKGKKHGVRCKGEYGFMGPTRDIQELEMNFRSTSPVYHWTIYKDRNYGMYGLDGRKYEDCSVTTGNDYHCERWIDDGRGTGNYVIHGYRKFHCKSLFTAGEILSNL
ncbi:hypothetical protein FLONG3_11130 [Fusarium longipes]|uniref:Uncharacterized protein n=1 Tax=Fusarium longipes TaxID=694270 RepID=A0A395RIN8_9HYPO|nr:hypothetical protein FLONG3_11130 [Fusarium longipes]